LRADDVADAGEDVNEIFVDGEGYMVVGTYQYPMRYRAATVVFLV
jgi:hypothetical protein